MTSKGRKNAASREASQPQDDMVPYWAPDRQSVSNRSGKSDLIATQHEVAVYVEGLTAGLRAMAQSADLDGLAYFLEMARLEASIQAERLTRSAREAGFVSDV